MKFQITAEAFTDSTYNIYLKNMYGVFLIEQTLDFYSKIKEEIDCYGTHITTLNCNNKYLKIPTKYLKPKNFWTDRNAQLYYYKHSQKCLGCQKYSLSIQGEYLICESKDHYYKLYIEPKSGNFKKLKANLIVINLNININYDCIIVKQPNTPEEILEINNESFKKIDNYVKKYLKNKIFT